MFSMGTCSVSLVGKGVLSLKNVEDPCCWSITAHRPHNHVNIIDIYIYIIVPLKGQRVLHVLFRIYNIHTDVICCTWLEVIKCRLKRNKDK